MSRLVGQLLAVPVRLIADVIDFLKITDPTPLRSVAWKFSNDPQDGVKLLILVCHNRGIAGARELAEEMIAKVNDSLLAATMGGLEIQYGQGPEASKKWLEHAKKMQAKRQELLLNLELYLSETSPEYNKAELIETILMRNDLPMDFSRHALRKKAELFLQNRQWGSAREIADRILNLEEEPFTRWIKWVTAIAQDDGEDADLHIKKVKGKWPDVLLLSMTALGWFYIGNITQTMKLMHQAEHAGAKFEYICKPLMALASSDEYQNSKEENSK
ncbi:MAG: hypothetical protein ACYTBV_11875 [Planctomycetota bacterium]|jgi:hypothetical protein